MDQQEKASKNQRNPMLFWESKLIHKMRGKSKYTVRMLNCFFGLANDSSETRVEVITVRLIGQHGSLKVKSI